MENLCQVYLSLHLSDGNFTFAKWKTDTVLRPTPQMATAIMRTPSTKKVEEKKSTISHPDSNFVKVVKALKVLLRCDFDPGVEISLSSRCQCSTGSLKIVQKKSMLAGTQHRSGS